MKRRIVGIFVCTLLMASAFGSITTVGEDLPDWQNMTMEEIITKYDPNCQGMTVEEIAAYIESVRIKSLPEIIFDKSSASTLQDPENPGSRPLIYEPPWDVDYDTNLTEQLGIAGGSFEAGTTPYLGYAHMDTWAGPGAGEFAIAVWLYHGFYFVAPATTTYTFTFTYSIEGRVHGEIGGVPVPSACASSEVALFFRVGAEEVKEEILKYQTGLVFHYIIYFDETRTVSMQVQLIEGIGYNIGASGAMAARAMGFLAAMGISDGDIPYHSDGAILEKVTIDWPNHPPETPSRPDGPSIGKAGVEYTYTTSAIDPDGIGDSLWYKWSWGDSTSGWLGPYLPGETVEASHSWNDEDTYNVKVKVKDSSDVESPWSDPLPVIIKSVYDLDIEITKPKPSYLYTKKTGSEGRYMSILDFFDGLILYINMEVEVTAQIDGWVDRVEIWIRDSHDGSGVGYEVIYPDPDDRSVSCNFGKLSIGFYEIEATAERYDEGNGLWWILDIDSISEILYF